MTTSDRSEELQGNTDKERDEKNCIKSISISWDYRQILILPNAVLVDQLHIKWLLMSKLFWNSNDLTNTCETPNWHMWKYLRYQKKRLSNVLICFTIYQCFLKNKMISTDQTWTVNIQLESEVKNSVCTALFIFRPAYLLAHQHVSSECGSFILFVFYSNWSGFFSRSLSI